MLPVLPNRSDNWLSKLSLSEVEETEKIFYYIIGPPTKASKFHIENIKCIPENVFNRRPRLSLLIKIVGTNSVTTII